MIRVNLLPHATDRRAPQEGSQTWLVVVMFVVVAQIVGLFFFHQTMEDELASVSGEVRKLQAQIAEDKKTVKDHEAVKAELSKLRAREDAIAKLQAGRKGPTAVLLELSRILTQGAGPTIDPKKAEAGRKDGQDALFNPTWDTKRLWLTGYSEANRSVKLEGMARDGGDVYELAQRLKLSVYFDEVELLPGRQQKSRGGGDAELVAFALQVKVKY